jgi:anti-anti-sigma factor
MSEEGHENMTAMELETTDRDGVTIVSMSGDLEVQEIDEFKSTMDEVLRSGPQPRAVLDVSGVTRMTSYVVALIGFYNAQFKQARGRMVVSGATSPAQRALELSGLTAVINSADTVEQAMEAFSA